MVPWSLGDGGPDPRSKGEGHPCDQPTGFFPHPTKNGRSHLFWDTHTHTPNGNSKRRWCQKRQTTTTCFSLNPTLRYKISYLQNMSTLCVLEETPTRGCGPFLRVPLKGKQGQPQNSYFETYPYGREIYVWNLWTSFRLGFVSTDHLAQFPQLRFMATLLAMSSNEESNAVPLCLWAPIPTYMLLFLVLVLLSCSCFFLCLPCLDVAYFCLPCPFARPTWDEEGETPELEARRGWPAPAASAQTSIPTFLAPAIAARWL